MDTEKGNGASGSESDTGVMPLKEAIDLLKFYEESANKIKDRVWTVTTWILTLNTGIIGFCFTLYAQQYNNRAFIFFEAIACVAGIALCYFLRILIQDQGEHISSAWTRANKIKADNAPLNKLLNEVELAEVRKPEYKAAPPRFCARLMTLTRLFIGGFIGIITVMMLLRYT